MIIGQDIVSFYEHFYSKKYGNKTYKFKPTERANQEIQKFLSHFNKKYNLITLGPIFLSRYFSFQFKRVEGQSFKRFASKDVAGRVQIYDIIGRKPIEYWENRDIKFDYTLSNSDLNLLRKNQEERKNQAEEIEKKRFFNTERGLVNCLERTTLYYHRSQNCIICIHKNNCKDLLKVNYNRIFNERGYQNATT